MNTKKYNLRGLIGGAVAGLLLAAGLANAATILMGNGGGTGFGPTTSASNVGKFLRVSSSTPYLTYDFASALTATPTFQQVTDAGAITTNAITYAGGTSTAGLVVQGLLTAPTGSFTYLTASNTNFTFATVGTLTGSNATITNVSSTNMSVSSSLLVAGKAVCLVDGTNCLPTSTPTLQQVTDAGNTTTNTIQFGGGTSTAALAVQGTLTATGASDLQGAVFIGSAGAFVNGGVTAIGVTSTNLFATNTTIINATSTNIFSTTGTFTNLVVTAAVTGGSLAISGNATIGGTLGVTGASTLATTTVTNFTATRTSTLATTTITSLSVNGVSYPSAAGTAGQIFRSNGTNFVLSTSLWPDTTTANQILYSSAANTIAGITTANNGVLITSGAGVPSIATDIPTAVTLGGSYIYRAGGTDVPVADGGTGASSLTANGVLLGNGTSAVQVTATGTANQVLTSNGGGSAPTFQALPGATYGTSTLSSDFTLSSSAGTFEDTGLSITLPSAGVYYIFGDVRAQAAFSGGVEAFIQVKFYNSTDGVYIDEGRAGAYTNKTGSDQLKIHTIPIQTVIHVNGSKTIKLYAARMSATTFIVSSIASNSEGRTLIGYLKILN